MGDGAWLRSGRTAALVTALLLVLGCGPAAPTAETVATAIPGPTVTLIAAGDIARCDSQADEATAALVETIAGTVVTLGDNAYPAGSEADFARCYDPSWGRFRDRTLAVPGNHDHESPGAAPYFDYFGPRAGPAGLGWYAETLGGWRLITLDSECGAVGGCGPGSPQHDWLTAELADHPSACTVVAIHRPRFSSGQHGGDAAVEPLWRTAVEAGADVVLHGHEHSYERLGPLDAAGAPSDDGATVFVVGTGGGPLRGFPMDLRSSRVRIDSAHGVLVLTLGDGAFVWAFRSTPAGDTRDAGTGRCH
jgi:alkaline phosphatase